MDPLEGFLVFALIALALVWQAQVTRLKRRQRVLERERAIRAHVFPAAVLAAVPRAWPRLGLKEAQLAARALRQFFIAHARAPHARLAMPSQAADVLWHAFILDTRAYQAFCERAFGAFFHHLPAGARGSADEAALAHTWRLACLEENIDPDRPTRVPLLFALDAKLGLPGAVGYDTTSFPRSRAGSDGSGCGGSGGGHDHGGGDGGGDGGGGCGGGD